VSLLFQSLFTRYNKHTTFLCYGVDYDNQMFYDTGTTCPSTYLKYSNSGYNLSKILAPDDKKKKKFIRNKLIIIFLTKILYFNFKRHFIRIEKVNDSLFLQIMLTMDDLKQLNALQARSLTDSKHLDCLLLHCKQKTVLKMVEARGKSFLYI
jgi:hypothetical protein